MQLPWHTPGFDDNPYAAYRQLGTEPVRADKHSWVLAGHAGIIAVLKDARFGFRDAPRESAPSDPGQAGSDKLRHLLGQAAHLRSLWFSSHNPPDHTRLRAGLAAPFSPASIAGLRPRIQAAVDALIDRVQDAGEMDVIRDLADPLPIRVVGEMLGIPLTQAARLKAWADEAVPLLDQKLRPVDHQRGLLAIAAFAAYLRPVIAERQRAPQADAISQLLASLATGQISPDELLANYIGFFFGGQETTSATVGNALLALLRYPEQMQRLRAEPELIAPAVDELLRYDSPAQFVSRTVMSDVELVGCGFHKNESVMLLIGAANRDPAAFTEPDRLALDRTPNPHLSFGHGIHYCLGAHLARLEAQVVVSTVLRRLPRLALQDRPLEWRPGLRLRALKSLPVRF